MLQAGQSVLRLKHCVIRKTNVTKVSHFPYGAFSNFSQGPQGPKEKHQTYALFGAQPY